MTATYRVLLQQEKTRAFLSEQGAWTKNVDAALDLRDSVRAFKLIKEKGMTDVQIILQFRRKRFTIRAGERSWPRVVHSSPDHDPSTPLLSGTP